MQRGFENEICLKLEPDDSPFLPAWQRPFVDRYCEYAAVHFLERMGCIAIQHTPTDGSTLTSYVIEDVNSELLNKFIEEYAERREFPGMMLFDEAREGAEVEKEMDQSRCGCRTLKLNLLVKEGNDVNNDKLFLVCNGKEKLLKRFNETAARAVTLYVLKNPGRNITRQELQNNCSELTEIKDVRVSDLVLPWPGNDDCMREFIRGIFFKTLSNKSVYFLGKREINLP
jgi:hypothetical protein